MSVKTNTEIIVLSVTNSDPTLAEKLTNETAKVFMEKVTEIYKINNVQVVDQAEVSTTPSNVNHTKDVIMFAAIGIVVSIIYVIGANMLDTTVKTAEDVEKQFDIYKAKMESLLISQLELIKDMKKDA